MIGDMVIVSYASVTLRAVTIRRMDLHEVKRIAIGEQCHTLLLSANLTCYGVAVIKPLETRIVF